MYGRIKNHLAQELEQIRDNGLFKDERIIAGRQGSEIHLVDGRQVINLCANNYLGLSGTQALVEASKEGLERWGYGLSSVRFICGTQLLHKELERKVSEFLGTADTILYSSCFDANGGLFEALLGPEDAVISDELNHASIIDGIRLCKARRYRYKNNDMKDLEVKLQEAAAARFRLIASDGVFSMDGIIANLNGICELAEKYDALVMIDDSHATGFIGKTGRGTPEYYGVRDRVDIITSTFGKAIGGASGGFTSGRREIVEILRQRSRPYLFSNTLAPGVAAAVLKAIDMLFASTELRDTLAQNTRYFRAKMKEAGFKITHGDHPIVPIMLGDAKLATLMADHLLAEGIYVIGFSYPVVPQGKARIRVQISAALTTEALDRAVSAFIKVGRELSVI
ncbi:MAG: glycine C-acetyltransferase [Deltaproteobacteria bacterium]|nr:glycine C-acetyltransferase [Deltaproteobacteria bacterium]MBW2298595.1 glycine C-acetyltransferase [Deltaproteobacteria bacterium]